MISLHLNIRNNCTNVTVGPVFITYPQLMSTNLWTYLIAKTDLEILNN